jgi:hypothetical protein
MKNVSDSEHKSLPILGIAEAAWLNTQGLMSERRVAAPVLPPAARAGPAKSGNDRFSGEMLAKSYLAMKVKTGPTLYWVEIPYDSLIIRSQFETQGGGSSLVSLTRTRKNHSQPAQPSQPT